MPHALQFFVLTMAGWLNRHQEDLIEYLREENRVLREQLGSRPLRLTNAQRRRLAVRGKRLGRRALAEVAGIVTPDTILRWYRSLIRWQCPEASRPTADLEGDRQAGGEDGPMRTRGGATPEFAALSPTSDTSSLAIP